MSGLKPCPFCGKDAQMAGADRGPVFAVWCGGCGACGGTSCSKERAIDYWNCSPMEDELVAALEGLLEHGTPGTRVAAKDALAKVMWLEART